MTSRQPPFSMLRAFAAAARHESLRLGANELGVTPSAISHQLRALEEWLGSPLFDRIGREVRLTPAGRELAGALISAIDAMSAAVTAAKAAVAGSSLRVSALPLFTAVWLIPRLHRFEAIHPGVSIEIETGNRLADLTRDGIDVAIRNSAKPGGALCARKLMDVRAVPLCAPKVAERIACPQDLKNATLIHLSAGSRGWKDWLAGAGLSGLEPRSNLSLDTIPAALEAALQGHGVMLGLDPLIWDAPAAGRLVVPFATALQSGGAYFVVHRRADRSNAAVRAFVEWIVAEMRSDLPRLREVSQNRLARQPANAAIR